MIQQMSLAIGSIFLLSLCAANAQEFTSSRATAIGGYVAVSDDVYAPDWNLAAAVLGRRKLEVAFENPDIRTHESFDDFRILWRPWGKHLLAFSSTPGINKEHQIFKLPFFPDPDEFDPLYLLGPLGFEQDLTFGYAFRASSKVALGAGLKRQNFYNRFTPSRFWSFDLHTFFKVSERLSFGMVVRNLHTSHQRKPINRIGFMQNDSVKVLEVDFESFETVFTQPERRLEVGVAYRPFKSLLMAWDLFSDGGVGVGLEWRALAGLYLRSGMSHKLDGLFRDEKVFAVTWGVGVRYQTVRLDLAYYFPYGARDSSLEVTPFGEFVIRPGKDDRIMFSAAFGFR